MKDRLASAATIVARPWASVGLATLVAGALAAWIVSPRFGLEPSLVDDWAAISRSPSEMHDMLRLDYHETMGRFRPGFVVWNYLQWHTFGGSTDTLAPDVWGIARILLLAAGLASLTAVLLRPRARGLATAPTVTLVLLPSLLMLTTPGFSVDVARFGPQEPALVGGMALGGSAFFVAAGELLGRGRPSSGWWAAPVLVAAYALWLFGVYTKESSICVVLLCACLLVGHRRSLAGVRALRRGPRVALATLAVLVVLPLFHVAYETVAIARRGDLVYGMKVEPDKQAVGRVVTTLDRMASAIGSEIGLILLVAIGVSIAAAVIRRRPDWTVIGLFLTAVASLVWSAQSGQIESRYYQPTVALLAVALVLLLASLPAPLRLAGVVAFLVLAVVYVPFAHRKVGHWAATERRENRFVRVVRSVQETGCPVVVNGIDLERSQALPVLARLGRGPVAGCPARTVYVVLGTMGENPVLRRPCESGTGRVVGSWQLAVERVTLTRCGRLTPAAARVAHV